jgi:hypothetical protein
MAPAAPKPPEPTSGKPAKQDESIPLPEYEAALERGYIGERIGPDPDDEYTVEAVAFK